MMFSEALPGIVDFLKDLDTVPGADRSEVQRLLEKSADREGLSLEEVARLVVSAPEPENRELILGYLPRTPSAARRQGPAPPAPLYRQPLRKPVQILQLRPS